MFYLLEIMTGISGTATGGSSRSRRRRAPPARSRCGRGWCGGRRRGRGRGRRGRVARTTHRGAGRAGRCRVGLPPAPAAPTPRRASHALHAPPLSQEVSYLSTPCLLSIYPVHRAK